MRLVGVILILGLVLGVTALGLAENVKRVASIMEFQGTVEVKMGKAAWQSAQKGMTLNPGDMIRTKKNSFALLNVDGKAETATVEVKENSQVKLSELLENKKDGTQSTLLDLALGNILIKAKKLHSEKSKFEVKTPTSIVAVRGTTFSVAVEAIE
ncbi:MAG: FecR domain-containing protein [Candidatus Omnitrophica bacterium]|nr:FecR domain-containing protein [Candidatus Omnitrophota bacterium]